jgi:hypothetical protein
MAMMLCWVGVASASSTADMDAYLGQKIDQFNATGVGSDSEVYSVWIDLSNISSTGSVSTSVYENGGPAQVSSFQTNPISLDTGVDKITRLILGNIANTYRQSPQLNTTITMIVYQRTAIPVYAYGDHNKDAINDILTGLPTCFTINYNTGGGGSSPTTPISMPAALQVITPDTTPVAQQTALFTVNSQTYSVNGTAQTMDVAPVIQDNQALVPVRYLAESLGVPDSGVQWNGETQQVTITDIDPATIVLTIGSTTETVNGKPQQMDAAPYILDGRTMLPARWIAEPLGATVAWNAVTQQTTITQPAR